MKTCRRSWFLAAAVALACAGTSASAETASTPKEITAGDAVAAPAPASCLATVRAILAYAFRSEPDILRDTAAQDRWLTAALKKELLANEQMARDAQRSHPDDRVDLPSNVDLYGFWDQPTSYAIQGSRTYGTHAVVDVEFQWGAATNYPGDKERVAYSLELVQGHWLLDDVYHFRGAYSPNGSLSQQLQAPL